ncbi:MAG: signal peptidase I [Candidatus Woykebacteria bacterium RBG_19FT_COMBO_43_10]|uniref:Signal peptidase I n=1 Tax=Candidatus Woykebacteria bacterium RBG_19FT_COMBO_43_10 TaxID=1802598 RepID=A0A1G1WH08_9BACT|nr:MAG: signal peptidase I [Candidatus Woykebacteria bacterium RBG_19FT_COMBO_43_10]
MEKIIKLAQNLLYILFIAAIVVFGAAFVLSVFGKEGTYQLFVVRSGSMKPSIEIGSVLLVQPTSQVKKIAAPLPTPVFQKGDIVTYLSGNNPITHRVVRLEESDSQFTYQTKGDANRTPDQGKVSEKQILGKTILVVPFVGHAVNFAKTQMGYIFLIVVPITLIIYSEILTISSEVRKIFSQRKRRIEAI